jgi:uncharacterized membrane protein YccC
MTSNVGSEPEPRQMNGDSSAAVEAHPSMVRAVAFVVRCSGAATCAYVADVAIGLPHAVWAAISALIVSQERLDDTTTSLTGRIAGTIIGACIAVAVGFAGARLTTSVALQIAVAVAVGATIARERPALRVCMWTAPIVLLTMQPGVPILTNAAYRTSEVILGALVGGAFHWGAEVLIHRRRGRPGACRSELR